MTKTKEQQIILSNEIAKELIEKNITDISFMTKKEIHNITHEKCGDYILSLPELSDNEFQKAEKNNTDYKSWNYFEAILKFDFNFLIFKQK